MYVSFLYVCMCPCVYYIYKYIYIYIYILYIYIHTYIYIYIIRQKIVYICIFTIVEMQTNANDMFVTVSGHVREFATDVGM